MQLSCMCICYQLVFLNLYTALCPALASIPNGAIIYAPDMMADFDVGTLATYSCSPGFRLVGPQTRVCLLSMTWSDQPPVCQRK